MGDFRRNSGGFGGRDRDRGGFGGRDSGRSSGGFGGGRGRSSGGFGGGRGRSSGGFGGGRGRGPVEMHDVVCDKCKKDCQVPFKPSNDKPVLCSDCFSKSGGGSRGGSRDGGSGVSKEQLDKINTKLDKILKVLQELEMAPADEEAPEKEETSEEDSE
ncbi:CxxC-x17-CxxC domain-containing protein [Nanoarchaeota archaeon]